jgi:aminoglycoside 6'-N-acetyltransferase
VIYPIRTQRLSISPLSKADIDQFVAYRQDPQVARFQSWDSTYSKEQALQLIEDQRDVLLPTQGNWMQLALRLSESEELVGDLALHSLLEAPLTFEIGFTLAARYQGIGYGKEATAALMAELVDFVGARKFIAHIDQRNLPAAKLLSSLGFVQVPQKGWSEEFKGERVQVDYYEIVTA